MRTQSHWAMVRSAIFFKVHILRELLDTTVSSVDFAGSVHIFL